MAGSLGARIFGGFGLAIVLTLGVAGIVFFSLLGGYRQQLDRNTLQRVADQVFFGLNEFASTNVVARDVGPYLARQSQETGALLFILDADGRVVRDFSPGAEYNDLQLPITLADVRVRPSVWQAGDVGTGGARLSFLARLIPVDRFGRGAFVAVSLPEGGNADVVGDLLPRLLISGAAGLAVALLVSLVVTRSIFTPLQRVTQAARAVGRGRYDTRVPETGPEEARQLARAFNRMTQEVEHNEQTLQDFMADVSHELRTPLTSIRGFAQAMVDGTVREEPQRQRSAQVIADESTRMLRLVEDLLDLSRIQAGSLQLQREAIDPGELLTHIAEVFTPRAADAGLTIATQVHPGAPPIAADFDRLVQVLTNIVDNAIQHTQRGAVTLAAAPDGAFAVSPAAAAPGQRAVVLTVRDTGEGIPPQDLDRLFDRFYRGAGTGRRRGTGLGLAISREIVRAHGGEIQVVSRRGIGTEFRITLPAATAAPPPGPG